MLFLVFFRYSDATVDIPEEEIREGQPPWQTAVLIASLCLLHGLVVIVLTAIFAIVLPDYLSGWANGLGLMGAILAAIQYLPQIYTTYHLKHVGSLSIPMMCIQTPGGVLFAASLFGRLGWAGWSPLGIFLLTAVMQGTLLFIAIYYEMQKRSGVGHTLESESPPPPQSPKSPDLPPHRRPINYRTRLDDSAPSRYSDYPEDTRAMADQTAEIIDNEDSETATETQPLLLAGGRTRPRKQYDSQDGS